MREFLKKNSLAFAPDPNNPGPANVAPHYIITDPEARPVHCRPARASEYARKAIDQQIDRGLKGPTSPKSAGPDPDRPMNQSKPGIWPEKIMQSSDWLSAQTGPGIWT